MKFDEDRIRILKKDEDKIHEPAQNNDDAKNVIRETPQKVDENGDGILESPQNSDEDNEDDNMSYFIDDRNTDELTIYSIPSEYSDDTSSDDSWKSQDLSDNEDYVLPVISLIFL